MSSFMAIAPPSEPYPADRTSPSSSPSARSSLSLCASTTSTDPSASASVGPPVTPLSELGGEMPSKELGLNPHPETPETHERGGSELDSYLSTANTRVGGGAASTRTSMIRPGYPTSGGEARRSSSYEHPKKSSALSPSGKNGAVGVPAAASSSLQEDAGHVTRRRSKSGSNAFLPSPPSPAPSFPPPPAASAATSATSQPPPKQADDLPLPSQSFSFGTCPSINDSAPIDYTLDPLRSTPTAEMGEFHYSLPSFSSSSTQTPYSQRGAGEGGGADSAFSSRRSSRALPILAPAYGHGHGHGHAGMAAPNAPAPLELGHTYRRNSIVAHLTSSPITGRLSFPPSSSSRPVFPLPVFNGSTSTTSASHSQGHGQPTHGESEFSPPPTRRSSTCSTLLPLPVAGRRPSILHSSSTNSPVPPADQHAPAVDGTVLLAERGSAIGGLVEAAEAAARRQREMELELEAGREVSVHPEEMDGPLPLSTPTLTSNKSAAAVGQMHKTHNDSETSTSATARSRRTSMDRPAPHPHQPHAYSHTHPNFHPTPAPSPMSMSTLDRRRPSLLFQPPRLPAPIPPSLLARRGSLPASQFLGGLNTPGGAGSGGRDRAGGHDGGAEGLIGDIGPILVPGRTGSLSFASPSSPSASASGIAPGAAPLLLNHQGQSTWTTSAAALYRRSSAIGLPLPSHYSFASLGRRDSSVSNATDTTEATEGDTGSSYSSSSVRTLTGIPAGTGTGRIVTAGQTSAALATAGAEAEAAAGDGELGPEGRRKTGMDDGLFYTPDSSGAAAARRPSSPGITSAGTGAGTGAGAGGMVRRTSSPLVTGPAGSVSPRRSSAILSPVSTTSPATYTHSTHSYSSTRPANRPQSPASPSSGARYAPLPASSGYTYTPGTGTGAVSRVRHNSSGTPSSPSSASASVSVSRSSRTAYSYGYGGSSQGKGPGSHRSSIRSRSSLSGPSISSSSGDGESGEDDEAVVSASPSEGGSASGGEGADADADGDGDADEADSQGHERLDTPMYSGVFTDPWAGVGGGGRKGSFGLGSMGGGGAGLGQTSPVVEEAEGEGETPPAL